MFSEHWSSCALHAAPARWPTPCNCGGFTDSKRPDQSFHHVGYSLVAALRNYRQLWQARLVWKRENRASLYQFLKAAMRLRSGHRPRHNREGAVQRS